jgi:hypothetical protein
MKEMMAQNAIKVDVGSFNSRTNFPPKYSAATHESSFLASFEKAYLRKTQHQVIIATEFALQHFGRADLVWIAWNPDSIGENFSALALHKQLRRRKLVAFEAKLKDWKKGLQQAFRYRYFADKSVLVMPNDYVRPALTNLGQFVELEVGLWSFEKHTGRIIEHFSPNRARAISRDAREEAISLISGKIDLCKIRKHLDAIVNRV